MKKIQLILVAVVITVFAGVSFAAQSGAQISPQDGIFVRDAALENQMQLKMGQMAARQGASQEVKSFAQKMVKDTAGYHQELKSLAQRKGIPVPSALDSERQMKVDELAKKSGADFDRAFVEMMAPDHRNHIDRFAQEASRGKDPDLKSFATKELPKLRQHQSELDRLQPKVAKK